MSNTSCHCKKKRNKHNTTEVSITNNNDNYNKLKPFKILIFKVKKKICMAGTIYFINLNIKDN